MDITAVIPTRNRSRILDRALASVAAQSLPRDRFEVIVVDNGSTDDTAAVCAAWAQRIPNFRRIMDDRPGLHIARHTGLRAAQSELIVYADDDIRALPTWLEGMVSAFENASTGLVGGNIFPDFESRAPDWWEHIKQNTSWGWAVPPLSVLNFGNTPTTISPSYIWGCNFGVRRQLLIEVGGFHPDGMPVELLHRRGDGESHVAKEIVNKGYCAGFEPKASVYHLVSDERLSPTYFELRGHAQGVSRVYTEIRQYAGLSMRCRVHLLSVLLRARVQGSFESHCEPRAKLLLGYAAGIKAHMHRCSTDSELIDWINRPTYLE